MQVEERMATLGFTSLTRVISTSHMRLRDRQKLKGKCKVSSYSLLHLKAFWFFVKMLAGREWPQELTFS
jgi:hypothetical protein